MRHEVDLDGRTISYLDVSNRASGSPDFAAHPRTLLLLHAFPLAAEMWTPQLAAVPSGWRFIAPDLRGFGASSPDADPGCHSPSATSGFSPSSLGSTVRLPNEEPGSLGKRAGTPSCSIDDYARDTLSLLDHLQIREAVVCGLSMGGYAAFAFCRLAPERVRGLVLADTRPDADSPAGRVAREQSLQVVARDGVPALAENMLPRLLGRTSIATRPGVVDAVRRLACAQPSAAVKPAIVRMMTRPDSMPLLGTIHCPTLVIAGEEDEITGPDVARQMHGQVGRASLALIGHAGHLSNLERPEAFNEALDRFLKTRL